jgi:hypothetical protein
MLKWDHQPAARSRGWTLSIREQRLEISDVPADNPGLEPRIAEAHRAGLSPLPPRGGKGDRTGRGYVSGDVPLPVRRNCHTRLFSLNAAIGTRHLMRCRGIIRLGRSGMTREIDFMRPLAEHDLRDWLRLRPITQGWKQARYGILNFSYEHRGAAALGRFLREHADLVGGNIAISVAFNQPTIIEWQLRFWPHMVKDAKLIIADNSNDPAAATDIARLCARAKVPYLKLPLNPARQIFRSHALALNWLYRNLVRGLDPAIFAFVDHDLVPVEPLSFHELLGGQPFYGTLLDNPFYGARIDRSAGWYLWAGYCLFSYARIKSRKLDFMPDWFIGLDTGGANWWRLYRYYDKSTLRFATVRHEKFPSVDGDTITELERMDGWVHARNASQYHKGADSRPLFARVLEQRWSALQAAS